MATMYTLLVVAALSVVGHFLASSVAYFFLRPYESLSDQIFSFPVQIPARMGLLRLKYFFPFVRLPNVASVAPRAVPWLHVARLMGFLFLCAAVGFLLLAFLVKPT
jgi:hypothetical protein